ncbi:hypothetical protein ACWD4B_23125 [Streptomyces sp. NPDC002536]
MDNEPPSGTTTPALTRYEPAPQATQVVLHEAAERALPAIRPVMPSVTAAGSWTYVELRPGDSVPVHLDGLSEPGVAPRRIGRLCLGLTLADEGGDFYIATTSSPDIWTGTELGEDDGYTPGTRLARRLLHPHVPAPGPGRTPT